MHVSADPTYAVIKEQRVMASLTRPHLDSRGKEKDTVAVFEEDDIKEVLMLKRNHASK